MESQDLALTMTGPVREREDSTADSAQALERAMAGDRAAFDELLRCYERRVLMTAWRLLGSKEDAQDAAQEVFLRLYRHLHRVDPKRPLLPWLYRMAVNVCHDLHRKQRRDTGLTLKEVDPASTAADPAGEITRAEQKQMIAAALQTLTERERAAVVLRDIQGLPTREVAGILGSRETTVRSQISSARMKMKRFVESMERRRL
jgi:RNA polymerase sigma-70 factor (ECF subfamily)